MILAALALTLGTVAMAKQFVFLNRDGRFLIGDEIINVNGARYVFFKRKVKYLSQCLISIAYFTQSFIILNVNLIINP